MLTMLVRCFGCSLILVAATTVLAADRDGTVNYHRDVSRLMQKHCIECHREGGVAPFGLESFDEVEANAPMIQEVLRRGTMPPWFAVADESQRRSPWINDRSLSEDEKQTLVRWITSGQQEGDAGDAPEPLEFSGSWGIGDPDVIYDFPQPVEIPASGFMPYEYIVIQTTEDEDRWVESVEILPGVREAVHHVLAYVIPPGEDAEMQDGVNYWAAYAPGDGIRQYPEGYARRLPRGSQLVLGMHYTPFGEATEDSTRIGLKFAESPPKYEVKTASLINTDFEIPPGARRFKVTATQRIPQDVRVLGYLPHAHLRGVAARYDVTSRSGKKNVLLNVPRYDFNWQLFYQYRKPHLIRKGSTLKYTAWYDNSEDNPANPDASQPVYWGEQTYEEMHLGYVEFVVPVRSRRQR